MIPFREPPFTINGVKSWIHCLDIHRLETSKTPEIPEGYHYHNYIEFLYGLDADAYVWINGEKHCFKSGDLIVINSEEMHCVSIIKPSHYICVKFSPSVLYSDDRSLFEFKYVTPFLSNKSHQKLFDGKAFENIDLHSAILEIMGEWNSQKPAFELMIRSNILRIFTEIFRYWDKNKSLRLENILTEPIKKALLYISENYESVTESSAADACGLSYNHFSTCFKKSVGLSFNDYVTIFRVNEAEKMLLSSDKSITEIAMSCGFSSSSHFISRFKQYKQITPGKFRIRTRKSGESH